MFATEKCFDPCLYFQVKVRDYLSAPHSPAASCLVSRDKIAIKMFVSDKRSSLLCHSVNYAPDVFTGYSPRDSFYS